MSAKSERGRAMIMMSSEDMIERARPFAVALVEHQERRTGSRMQAYESVARWCGVSSSWVRKLVGRQQTDLRAHQYLNLLSAYRSLCERLEVEAENERRLLAEMKGRADEALERAMGLADRSREKAVGGAKATKVGGSLSPATRPTWFGMWRHP